MSYTDASRAVVALRGDYPLALLAIARAAESLGRIVSHQDETLTVDGRPIVTASGTLQPLGPGGVAYLSPLEPPGLSFRIQAGSEALTLYGPGAIKRLFGDRVADLMLALNDVWSKIAAAGIDVSTPRAAMAAGVVAIPSAKAPGEVPDWWPVVVDLVQPVLRSYLAGSYEAAAAAARAAAAAADRWEQIEEAVKAIRDLPATAVGAVAGAASDVATGTLAALIRKAWPLLLLLGGVGGVILAMRLGLFRRREA